MTRQKQKMFKIQRKDLVSLCLLLSLLFLTGCATDRPKADVIKIGFIGPLTGDGAYWGLIEKNAIDLAVEEINEKGINGKRLVVKYEDGKCNGEDALTAARKLVEIDDVHILLASCSQEIIPLASYTEPRQILILGSYAASSQITNSGDFVFRNAYSNLDYAQTMVNTIGANQTVAIVTEVTEFAADLRDIFKEEFGKKGGKIVSEENTPVGDKDASTYVTKILAKKPDAVFINPTGPATGIPILKELRKQGYNGKVYGNFFGGSKTVQELPEAQGMIFFADPDVADTPRKAELFEKYKKLFGRYPDLEFPAASRYDAVYILAEAIRNVGEDAASIRDYLYAMKKFDGVLGQYHFDQNGDVVGITPSVRVIAGQKSVPLEAASKQSLQ